MPFWPIATRSLQYQSQMRGSSNYTGTTVTGGTANTKGSYTTIITNTPAPATGLFVRAGGVAVTNTATSMLLDIAIRTNSGPGTDHIVIPDIQVGYTEALAGVIATPRQWFFPLYVPAGSDIRARCAGQIASDTVSVGIDVLEGLPDAASDLVSSADTYGTVGASSRGTTVTPGASNAKGSWAELTTSAGIARVCRFLAISIGANALASTTLADNAVDIGIGSDGTNWTVLWADMPIRVLGTEEINYRANVMSFMRTINLKPGTRIASRASGSVASPTAIDVSAHCFS